MSSQTQSLLILGHRGRLGRALAESFPDRILVLEEDRPSGLARTADEWRDYGLRAAELIRREGPQAVVNCMGHTDVEGAEADPAPALAANGEVPLILARVCRETGAHLTQMSTDFVFDGTSSRPYLESDPVNPLSVYGRSKAEMEQGLRKGLPEALILRSAWFFGPGRPTFVDKVVARAQEGLPVEVTSRETGSPTYVPHLAGAILNLVDRRVSGLVHAVNSGRASRVELARRALALSGLDPDLVRPVDPGPSLRPAFSVLDTSRLKRLLGRPLPTWLEALSQYLAGGEAGR